MKMVKNKTGTFDNEIIKSWNKKLKIFDIKKGGLKRSAK